VAKVWNSPLIETFRKAQPKQWAELEQRLVRNVGFDPSTVKTATVFWPRFSGPGDPETFVVALDLAKPYDKAKVVAALTGKPDEKPDADGFYAFAGEYRVHPAGPTTLAIFRSQAADLYKKVADRSRPGPLTEPLKLAAADKHTLVAALNMFALPEEIRGDGIPPEFRAYKPLFKGETLTLKADLGKELTAEARMTFADAATASDAEKAVANLLELLTGFLDSAKAEVKKGEQDKSVLDLIGHAQDALKSAKIRAEGKELAVNASIRADLPLIAMAMQATGQVRGSAARATSQNNLKQIGLAMHNYHDTYGAFPPAAIVDKDGKPLLSWRVAILPYLEYDALYKEFKLDEPWDSDNNKKLLPKIPKIYLVPDVNKDGDTNTHYQVFVGGGAVFDPIQGTKLQAITDGSSNTLLCAEAETAVPWSKPDDLAFDPVMGVPKLGFLHMGVSNAAFCDGSVRAIKKGAITDDMLKALITRAGGEVVNLP
jgi:prepilin-type processing-associated H-X9-DG protein